MDTALSTDILDIFVKPDVAQQRYMGVFAYPPERYIKGIKRSEYKPSRNERWRSCCPVFSFVYAAIAAFEPEANRHESQKIYILRMPNSVSY